MKKQEEINKLLNLGYKELNEQNYSFAKFHLHKAYLKDKENYDAYVAMTKAYIMDCLYNEVECVTANEYLDILKREFGETVEYEDLKLLLETKK